MSRVIWVRVTFFVSPLSCNCIRCCDGICASRLVKVTVQLPFSSLLNFWRCIVVEGQEATDFDNDEGRANAKLTGDGQYCQTLWSFEPTRSELKTLSISILFVFFFGLVLEIFPV
jgi:hypothetical protein